MRQPSFSRYSIQTYSITSNQKLNSAEFLELVKQNNFTNHVTSPNHMSAYTLDLVLSPVDLYYVAEADLIPIETSS